MRNALLWAALLVLVALALGLTGLRWLIPPLDDPLLYASLMRLTPPVTQIQNPLMLPPSVLRLVSDPWSELPRLRDELQRAAVPARVEAYRQVELFYQRWEAGRRDDLCLTSSPRVVAAAEWAQGRPQKAAQIGLWVLQSALQSSTEDSAVKRECADLNALTRANVLSRANLEHLLEGLRKLHSGPARLEALMSVLVAQVVADPNILECKPRPWLLPQSAWEERQRRRVVNGYARCLPALRSLQVLPSPDPRRDWLGDVELEDVLGAPYERHRDWLPDLALLRLSVSARLFRLSQGRWPALKDLPLDLPEPALGKPRLEEQGDQLTVRFVP